MKIYLLKRDAPAILAFGQSVVLVTVK